MDKDSPKKNSTGIIIGIIVVAVIVGLIALIGSNASNSGNSPASTGTQAGGAAASLCSNFTDSSATSSISYAELIKDPAAYNGTNVVYTGQVVQILQNTDGTGVIRLAVAKEDYGWDPNSIIYVTYSGGTNAVNDDVVKIYGQLTGSETYTSEANFQITIPSMTACTIDDETQAPAAATPSAPAPARTQPSAPVTQPVATQPAPTPAPQAPVTPKTWHTVTTITAATTENTPPFTIQGAEWRATWSCEPGSSGDVPPSVFAQATDGDGGDAVATPSSCPSNNVTYFYDGPTTDYLQITSLEGDSVTVTIEDYY